MKYTVNFFCDVDFTIEADSPEKLKEKIKEIQGKEFFNEMMEYVYTNEVNWVGDENSNEVKWWD